MIRKAQASSRGDRFSVTEMESRSGSTQYLYAQNFCGTPDPVLPSHGKAKAYAINARRLAFGVHPFTTALTAFMACNGAE